MKCSNCGAELESGKNAKFCPYCGHKVEVAEHEPTTMPGAIHGIAKGVIDEIGKQLDYQRTHADEIEERKKKRERETLRQGLWILLVAVALIGGIIAFALHMAEKEKAEQKAAPTSIVYIQQELA